MKGFLRVRHEENDTRIEATFVSTSEVMAFTLMITQYICKKLCRLVFCNHQIQFKT